MLVGRLYVFDFIPVEVEALSSLGVEASNWAINSVVVLYPSQENYTLLSVTEN